MTDDATRLAAPQRILGILSLAVYAGATIAGLGYALHTQGRLPGVSFLYLDHLNAMLERGEIERMTDEVRVAMQLDADPASRSQLEYALGLGLALQGDAQTARAHLEAAIAQRPEDARPRLVLGEILANSGDLAGGRSVLDPVLASPSDGPRAARILGEAEFRAGRYDRALPHLERALADDAANTHLQRLTAQALFELGRPRDAADHARAAVAIDGGAGRDYLFISRALFAAGEHRAAIDALDAGVRALPEDVVLPSHLAWILATHPDPALRDPARALRMAEQDLARARDAYALGLLGTALAAAERRDEAIARLEEAIAIASDAALAHSYRAVLSAVRERGHYTEPPRL